MHWQFSHPQADSSEVRPTCGHTPSCAPPGSCAVTPVGPPVVWHQHDAAGFAGNGAAARPARAPAPRAYLGSVRALFGLLSICNGGGLEVAAGGVAAILGAASGDSPLTPLGGQKGSAGLVRALERRDRRCGQSVSKSSCAWARRAGSAQGTFPSALPGSTAVLGCFSHQPDALTCHTLRGKPASTGRGGVSRASKCRRWPAVMTPRHAALRADDAVASHRAADGAGPSIEGARTCAHGTNRGAVAVSRAF